MTVSLWGVIHEKVIHKNPIDVLSSLSEISDLQSRHGRDQAPLCPIVIVDGDPVRQRDNPYFYLVCSAI